MAGRHGARRGLTPAEVPAGRPARVRRDLCLSVAAGSRGRWSRSSPGGRPGGRRPRLTGAGWDAPDRPVTWITAAGRPHRRQWSSPSPPRLPETRDLLPAPPPRWPPCWRRFSCGGGAGRRSSALALVPAAAFGWVLAQLADGHRRRRGRETVAVGPDARPRDHAAARRARPDLRRAGHRRRRARARSTAPATSSPATTGVGRFAGNLTAFAGSMLGLVLADDLLLLYVFWELTTVFSFLLIGGVGHAAGRPAGGQPGADPHHRRRAWRCWSA